MLRGVALALVSAAVAGGTACRDDGGNSPPVGALPAASFSPSADPGGSVAAIVLPVDPSYPDTVEGLESLMGSLVQALRNDDRHERARLLLSLQLPAAEGWFREVFGPELGPALFLEHEPQRSGIGWLATHIENRVEAGLASIRVERFDDPDLPGAVGYQSAALGKMQRRVPLYSVRFAAQDGLKSWHVWSFVHHNGTFRYVGKMRRAESRSPPVGARDPLEHRLGDAARAKMSAAPP